MMELTKEQEFACKDLGYDNPMIVDDGGEYIVINANPKNRIAFKLHDINMWVELLKTMGEIKK